MSTLNVSNITDGTNSIETVYVARGSAKSWVNFNGTGTIAARDSLNVSSLIDNGAGDYTVNFNNSFSNADYCMTQSTILGPAPFVLGYDSATPRSTSSFRMTAINTAGGAGDNTVNNLVFIGDLP